VRKNVVVFSYIETNCFKIKEIDLKFITDKISNETGMFHITQIKGSTFGLPTSFETFILK
jgi:hypothetical protein